MRYWFLFCCVVFTHSAFAKELTVAFGYENYNFEQIFTMFEEETGIKVNTAAFKNDRLKVELLQHAASSSLPDAVIVPADFVGLTEIDFSALPETWFLSTTKERDKSAVMQGNSFMGIPIVSGNHLVMYYNKRLISNPASSWRELIKQKIELSGTTKLIRWSFNEMYWFLPFVAANGDLPLQNGKINLDTDGMQLAMEYYWSLAKEEIVDPNCDYQCSADMFTSGKLAYTINGVWALSHFKSQLGDDLGISLLPAYEGKRLKPYYSVHALAFPNQSAMGEKAEWLKRLALFFQSTKIQDLIWQQLQSLPTNENSLQTVLAAKDDNLQYLIRQLEYAEPMPNDRNMAIVWEAMLKGMQRYQAGLLTLEQASRYMQYIATRSAEELQKAN